METDRPPGWTVPTGDDSHVTEAIISACLHGSSVETFEQLHNASAPHLIPPPSYLVRCAAASNHVPVLSYIIKLYPLGRLKADKSSIDTLPYWERISLLDQSFSKAISNGHIEIVKRLLKAGMPVKRFLEPGTQYTLEQALDVAIGSDQIEVAHLLLKRGAKPNVGWGGISDMNCTRSAITKGSDDMLQLILDYGGNIEECNALRYMAKIGGSLEKAQRLLNFGVDINEHGSPGKYDCGTALHATAGSYYKDKCLEFAEWLLRNGIDHTIKDSEGRTALEVAQTRGTERIATLIETWIRDHTTQNSSPRRLRSSKRSRSPFQELETSKKNQIKK